MPAAVSQTEIKMDMSWASLQKGSLAEKIVAIFHLMEVEVFSMLRYCRMSGTDIKRRARKKPNPEKKEICISYSFRDTTYPCSIQVYGDNGLGDGEEVDKRFEFQHKPKLV